MKFTKLDIKNFLVLTEASVSLEDRGLILVQGVNQADSSANSNGSGKSSLADALCWAIYGTTARGETGDAVVNNKVGKGTEVSVTIQDELVTYRITRYRKHKTHKNALHVFMDEGFGEKDLTKGTEKLTQEVVDKIIGASLDVFTGSIYAGQERMPDLPSMTDKMLKMLIEEAAGINALEEAYKKARENMAAAKNDVLMVSAEVSNMETALANLRSQRDSTVLSEQQWEANRKAQIQELTDRVRDQLIPQAKLLATQAPQSEIDRLTAEINTVDARIASVATEQVQLQKLSSALAVAQSHKTLTENAEIQARNVVQNLTKQLADVDHKVGCPCDSCGRPLTVTEMAAARAAVQSRLDQARTEFTAATIAAENAENALHAVQIALDRFKQGMTDLTAEVAQRASLEAQRVSLMQIDQQRQQVLAQAKNDMGAIERLKTESSPFVTTLAGVDANIATVTQGIATKKSELKVKQDRLDLETEVVRVFSPAGVRARVLDEVTPYLNSQTSKYLAILSDGNISAEWSTLTMSKGGELKERFAIDVTSVASSQTFKGLSGGEKRKVRVATALALQDLVATRATKPIDLFIGDEIDHALDASGLERLMVILDEKARERGTVVVISHNSLKDEIKQVLTVERSATGETRIIETAA